MANPVTAERLSDGSCILRWYQGGIGVNRHQVIAEVRPDGGASMFTGSYGIADQVDRAREFARYGLWIEMRAMATHRWKWSIWTLRRELVPIQAVRRG